MTNKDGGDVAAAAVEERRAVPSKMRAIVQDRYGTPDVLGLREVDVPTPAEDRVLIQTGASSLNMYDWHMTTGTPYMARSIAGWTKPKNPIPGADIAGTIVRVGSAVAEFREGDVVYGDIGTAAFAEYAVANPKAIARLPEGVSLEAAAAVPLAGLTALQGLRDKGELQAGQRVLINGASGGVGTFAVQIAKALGAEVTAVCSTTKVDTARSIGADRVIDYKQADFTATERGYDLLFDNAGNRRWFETSQVLRSGGGNVTITGPKHAVLGPFRNLLFRKLLSRFGDKEMTWFTAHVNQSDLAYLGGLLASGEISPVIERIFTLDELPAALRYLGEGHAAGKLVINQA